ncbi:MAG TPA: MarR family transcriptional regulator [Solirubrobacteraceae bacterium]|jgi:DNA-binding MarR family transcriptional regulator|nr:MarR family transcriptional regulator [Solirubrobacteraceae bacterium]
MASISNEPRPLDAVELRAWRGLLRAHGLLVKRLDAELEAEHGLPLTSYEVLVHLADTDGGKMRMCDVAESVLLSRSGLTRLVDRLERDGYVERVSCADDARGAYARLTDAGRAKVEAASTTHLEGIRAHFLAHFSPSELALLAEAWERVAAAAPAPGAPACSA